MPAQYKDHKIICTYICTSSNLVPQHDKSSSATSTMNGIVAAIVYVRSSSVCRVRSYDLEIPSGFRSLYITSSRHRLRRPVNLASQHRMFQLSVRPASCGEHSLLRPQRQGMAEEMYLPPELITAARRGLHSALPDRAESSSVHRSFRRTRSCKTLHKIYFAPASYTGWPYHSAAWVAPPLI